MDAGQGRGGDDFARLIWFDDDPARSVADKVARAAQRYEQKYGHAPDVCYVHSKAMKEDELIVGAVKVLPTPTVLLHHFWLGTMQTQAPAKKADPAPEARIEDEA